MSPFKEPQPRKGQRAQNLADGWVNAVKARNNSLPEPPLQDLGERLLTEPWPEEKVEEVRQAYANTPLMVLPDASNFQYRQAALQAAATMYAGALDLTNFWPNVLSFEDYLRNGAKQP